MIIPSAEKRGQSGHLKRLFETASRFVLPFCRFAGFYTSRFTFGLRNFHGVQKIWPDPISRALQQIGIPLRGRLPAWPLEGHGGVALLCRIASSHSPPLRTKGSGCECPRGCLPAPRTEQTGVLAALWPSPQIPNASAQQKPAALAVPQSQHSCCLLG